jgi:tyrosine aminotransferase
MLTQEESWSVLASETARRTFNPIRAIVDKMDLKPNPHKEFIPLSIGEPLCAAGKTRSRGGGAKRKEVLIHLNAGDPTAFPNLPPSAESVKAVQDVLAKQAKNGYPPAIGAIPLDRPTVDKSMLIL